MQPNRIARSRSVAFLLTVTFIGPLALPGCGSGSNATPVEQSIAGREAAKSSMDFMKKHRSESSPVVKRSNIKTH